MPSEDHRLRDKVFLTAPQATEVLNVSLVTFKKYITLGKIRAIRTPGGHYRIKKQDILENLYDPVIVLDRN